MKKPPISLLVVLTLVFAAFTLGFFLGRNPVSGTVTVSVPSSLQTTPPETTQPTILPTETTPAVTFPININTATQDTLMALPGIGEVLAQRILAYREENGPFANVEGLMNVKGIGQTRMEEILPLITTGGSQ